MWNLKIETFALLRFEICSASVKVLDSILPMAGNSPQIVRCDWRSVNIRGTWHPGKERTTTIPKLPWGPQPGGWRGTGNIGCHAFSWGPFYWRRTTVVFQRDNTNPRCLLTTNEYSKNITKTFLMLMQIQLSSPSSWWKSTDWTQVPSSWSKRQRFTSSPRALLNFRGFRPVSDLHTWAALCHALKRNSSRDAEGAPGHRDGDVKSTRVSFWPKPERAWHQLGNGCFLLFSSPSRSGSWDQSTWGQELVGAGTG